MLRKPTTEELEQYLPRAYELALDLTRSGYPTYLDEIKTKADFEEAVWRCMRRERDRVALLYEEEGKIAGLICFFFIPGEHYLQTVVFNIEGNPQNALAEFEAYCCAHFPAYELFLGFPKENQCAVSYFTQSGWKLIEDSYNDVCHLSEYQIIETDAPIKKVSRENFADFSRIHSVNEGDMYWNSSRIYEHIDEWDIWLYYKEGNPYAAIYYTDEEILVEIFGVDFANGVFDAKAYRALLRTVQNDCKEKGREHIVMFTDEETQQATLELGFRCVGEYLCFTKKA